MLKSSAELHNKSQYSAASVYNKQCCVNKMLTKMGEGLVCRHCFTFLQKNPMKTRTQLAFWGIGFCMHLQKNLAL
jgi:hypothetical protein